MIIDAHVHILPQRRLDGLSIWLGQISPNHPLAGRHFKEDSIMEELSRKGITYIFNYIFPLKENETKGLNLFNHNLSKRFKAIIPFGSLHADSIGKKSIVDLCIKTFRFLGFKLHPYVQGFSPDDERLFPAYERMEEYGALVTIHTGFDEYYPKKSKAITLSMMEGLIKRFSSLIFILPHMFYPRLNEAAYLLENYKNVIVDTTNVFSAIIQDEERGITREREKEILLEVASKWSQRMVFGTDHPVGMGRLDEIFRDFYLFDLKESIKYDLLFNAANNLISRNTCSTGRG